MKGNKLCFGLLLLFSIMVGLSLNVCSNVNAYKYDIRVLPLNYPRPVSDGGPNYETFVVSHSSDLNPADYTSKTPLKYLNSNVDMDSNNPSTCDYSQTTFLPQFYRHSFETSNDGYVVGYGFFGFSNGQVFPSSWHPPTCLYNLDNRVAWSGFYARDINTDDGFHAETKFTLDSVFGYQTGYPNKVFSLTIPLGTPSRSVFENLSTSTLFELQGEFVLDFDDPIDPLPAGLSSETEVHAYVDIIESDGGGSSAPRGTCSTEIGPDDPSDELSVWHLRYDCSFTLAEWQVDPDVLQFFKLSVAFSYLNSNTKLHTLIYDSSIIITDGDSSAPPDGDEWGDQSVYGTNIDQAPGSAKQTSLPQVESDGINWFQSLSNMFTFQVLNPFTPIFSLFSDSDSCANIPIIAGMLHSEDTQVCPWFSSNVRSVLTPVFGLSAMMLVFGFAVRWLGSSSGNFFEDSRHEEVSNQGGRWGHFKKGKQ